MTPYYEDEDVAIYHGDCNEIIPRLTDVDLVVTSPPYNKGHQSGDYANMKDAYVDHGDNMAEDDYVEWQKLTIRQLWDAVGPDGAIFYNHKPQIRDGAALLPTRLLPADVTLRQIIIWDRRGGMNWNASFFVPQHEWVLLVAHPEFRLTNRSASAAGDVWDIGIDQGTEGHPCAYPKGLPLRAIGATTATTILDPFMGSGTTLRAAKDLGRRAIGIEISERYCEIAATRLGQGVLDLFSTTQEGTES